MTTTERVASVFDFSKWSHFTKVLNIIAWVLRFVNNCRKSSVPTQICFQQICILFY